MRQLFLKAYLTVIALTVVTFLLVLVFVILPLALPIEWQDFKEETEMEYRFLFPQLNQADDETQMREILSAYQPVFDLKLSLVKISDLTIAQQNRIQNSDSQQILSEFEEDDWYAYYHLVGQNGGLLIEETAFSWEEEKLIIFLLFILPFLLIMAMLAIALVFTLYRLSRPLLELEKTAIKLGSGDMTARVKQAAQSPLRSLSITFNSMADRIEQLVTRQQVMIAAIPHELRTPLNRIHFALDMTRNKRDVAGLRDNIEKLDDYVGDLSTAVQDIVELNRLQQSGQPLTKENCYHVRLLPLLEKVASVCVESGRQLTIQCSPDTTVRGNSDLLYRALLNLVQNATKYAQQHIVLSTQQHQNNLVIRVDDDGEGVPEAQREQIFMPFHRLDSSRNRSTGGIGLGLALVQLIVEKHNGTIQATTSPLKGLRMEINLPFVAS